MIEVTLARPEDFDDPPQYRCRAYVVKKDGRKIGIGGLAFPPDLPPFLWSDISDELRAMPVTLHKTGLRYISEAINLGVKVMYATTDEGFEAGNRWLLHLGFEPTGEIKNGKQVYIWHAP